MASWAGCQKHVVPQTLSHNGKLCYMWAMHSERAGDRNGSRGGDSCERWLEISCARKGIPHRGTSKSQGPKEQKKLESRRRGGLGQGGKKQAFQGYH